MNMFEIGKTKVGLPITVSSFGEQKPDILLMSGLHGDEIEGVVLNALLTRHLMSSDSPSLKRISILQQANPEGFMLNQRCNVNNVDLNRNWPTKDWSPNYQNPRYPPGPFAASEKETQCLKNFIELNHFKLIVDLHSYKDSVLLPLFFESNRTLDHSLTALGISISIPVVHEQEDLGYSIVGGFHTWCFENRIHNLTVEIQKGLGQFEIASRYLNPLTAFIESL